MRNLIITTAVVAATAISGAAFTKFDQAHDHLNAGETIVIDYRFAEDGSFDVVAVEETNSDEHWRLLAQGQTVLETQDVVCSRCANGLSDGQIEQGC